MPRKRKEGRSEFAEALGALLDDSHVFSREEWASMLDLSQAAMSQWLTDKTVPTPDNLRRIVEEVEGSPVTPREVLERFWTVAQKPATEVSPLKIQERTFGHFLVRPLWEGFRRVFGALSPTEQTQVLAVATDMCTEYNHERLQRHESETAQLLEGPLVYQPKAPIETLPEKMDRIEREMILEAYQKAKGVKTETARLLGIQPSALYYKLEKHGIK